MHRVAPASPAAQGASSSAPSAAPSPSSAPAAGAARAPLNPPVTVNVGYNGFTAESTLFVAYDRGYFSDEGLNVQFQRFNTGSDQLPAVANGQLDTGTSAPQPGFFNAIARNIALKIVGYFQTTPKDSRSLIIVVRKDLLDSERYKTPADFKGMSIGVTDTTSLYTQKALELGGLTANDVNLVTMGYPDMLAAFTNKRIDAAQIVQPFGLQVERQGLAQSVLIAGDLFPGTPTSMLFFSAQFAQGKTEAANRFMVGFMRAQRDLYAAFDTSQGNESDKQAIYTLLTKYLDIKDPSQIQQIVDQGQFEGVPANGEMPLAGLQEFQDGFLANGSQPQAVDLSTAVDPSFATYAVQQLGSLPTS